MLGAFLTGTIVTGGIVLYAALFSPRPGAPDLYDHWLQFRNWLDERDGPH